MVRVSVIAFVAVLRAIGTIGRPSLPWRVWLASLAGLGCALLGCGCTEPKCPPMASSRRGFNPTRCTWFMHRLRCCFTDTPSKVGQLCRLVPATPAQSRHPVSACASQHASKQNSAWRLKKVSSRTQRGGEGGTGTDRSWVARMHIICRPTAVSSPCPCPI